ncbi:hypothetical protein CACET_c03760 [Clostridium aceticum]|uniref:DUF1850 domain-containing protein n=3 Tax=Clostridium aceticum TaxID=84022 RepID=A0A0G3W7K4_9CLOT|nr:hypothetical protein CACET_c03760 [Clostridium aceticum]
MILLISFLHMRFIYSLHPSYYLIIKEETTGEIFVSIEVEEGDEVAFHWIHSVEHIPWIEYFVIDEKKNFVLKEIRFKGFGAGIPHDKGEVKVEDGYIVMMDIEEKFEAYQWIHSHTATERITLNGEEIVKSTDLPHHEYIKMAIQER